MNNQELVVSYQDAIKKFNECRSSVVYPTYSLIFSEIFGKKEWPDYDETESERRIKDKICHCIDAAAGADLLKEKIKSLEAEAKSRLDDGQMSQDSAERALFFENF